MRHRKINFCVHILLLYDAIQSKRTCFYPYQSQMGVCKIIGLYLYAGIFILVLHEKFVVRLKLKLSIEYALAEWFLVVDLGRRLLNINHRLAYSFEW